MIFAREFLISYILEKFIKKLEKKVLALVAYLMLIYTSSQRELIRGPVV